MPILGPAFAWLGAKAVPRDALTWIQIESGPAAGLWMRVNPRTGRHILEGSGEPAVQQAVKSNLRPGMTVYDLGANIGFFSLLAARLVGPTGRVVSFEADPEIAARLRENVARNNFSWMTVEQLAVWSEARTVAFARADPSLSPDRGQGHIAAGDSDADSVLVNAVKLDDYCRTAAPPDFIKCDVEGAEVEVLRGASRVLVEKRPVVLCEMHSAENRRALLEQLSSLGYSCTDCDETHVLGIPR